MLGGWLSHPPYLFFMIKEIIAASLLTAAITPRTDVNYLYKSLNYTPYSQAYVDAEYYDGGLESSRTYTYKSIDNISYNTGICELKQFVLRFDRLDLSSANDKYLTDFYVYSLVRNKTVELNRFAYNLEGTINAYSSYGSFSMETYWYDSLPTNQSIIDALNGNYPTSYAACELIKNDYGMPLTNRDTYTFNTIGQIKQLVSYTDIDDEPITNLLYMVQHIIIDYNDSVVTNNFPTDLYYFPESMNLHINYTYNVPDNPEVVDIPGLLFEILGMPFAWISIAFNFTLFPGTVYAVNISHIIMGIVIGGIAIFIIKRILK